MHSFMYIYTDRQNDSKAPRSQDIREDNSVSGAFADGAVDHDLPVEAVGILPRGLHKSPNK